MAKQIDNDGSRVFPRFLAHPFVGAIVGAGAGWLFSVLPLPDGSQLESYRDGIAFVAVMMFADVHQSQPQIAASYIMAAYTLFFLLEGGILGLSVWTIVRFLKSGRLPLVARILAALVAAPTAVYTANVVPGVVVSAWGGYLNRAPSDSSLLRTFHDKRATFARLEQMLRADPQLETLSTSVAKDLSGTILENASAQRAAEFADYRSLLQSVEVVGSSSDAAKVEFFVWTGGPGNPSQKGYCRLASPPAKFTACLDGLNTLPHSDYVAYRYIADNWYLYYRHTADR